MVLLCRIRIAPSNLAAPLLEPPAASLGKIQKWAGKIYETIKYGHLPGITISSPVVL
jgi:hypothetical protein